jgi:hypothetical protein
MSHIEQFLEFAAGNMGVAKASLIRRNLMLVAVRIVRPTTCLPTHQSDFLSHNGIAPAASQATIIFCSSMIIRM